MIEDLGKYYLYRHIRLDKNEPFYIGIGTCNKYKIDKYNLYDRAFHKKSRNNLWKKIVNKTKYKVEIILHSDDYEFIKQKEKEFIKLYGRINLNTGILSNLTDGGEGTLNVIYTKEQRQKMSEKLKGNKRALGFKHSEDTRRKVKEIALKRAENPEWIKSLSERSSVEILSMSNKTGDIIFYKSIIDAHEKLNISLDHIKKCLKGGQKPIKGYRFFYKKNHVKDNIFLLNIDYI